MIDDIFAIYQIYHQSSPHRSRQIESHNVGRLQGQNNSFFTEDLHHSIITCLRRCYPAEHAMLQNWLHANFEVSLGEPPVLSSRFYVRKTAKPFSKSIKYNTKCIIKRGPMFWILLSCCDLRRPAPGSGSGTYLAADRACSHGDSYASVS